MGYIEKTSKKSYEYDELIPAYKYGIFKKPNVKEIARLCTVLINDGLVLDSPGKRSGGIVIKPQAIAAYFAGKYFQEEKKPGYSRTTIQAVIAGMFVIGGGLLLGYSLYDKDEKLQKAEQIIRNMEVRDQESLKQIRSLSSTRDSLRNVIKNQRTEIENLKKPAAKEPAKVKRSKK